MIIALTGKAGSGKNTFASEFASYAESYWHCDKFARPLYAAIAAIFTVPVDDLMHSPKLKNSRVPGFDFTYRKALQTLGTEWRDTIDRNLWITLLERRNLVTPHILITDLRFQHEADWVHSTGGIVVSIIRHSQKEIAESGHSSEQQLPGSAIDYFVYNSGALADLAGETSNFIAWLTEKGYRT